MKKNSALSRNSFSNSAKVVRPMFKKMMEQIEDIVDQLAFQIGFQKFMKNL